MPEKWTIEETCSHCTLWVPHDDHPGGICTLLNIETDWADDCEKFVSSTTSVINGEK